MLIDTEERVRALKSRLEDNYTTTHSKKDVIDAVMYTINLNTAVNEMMREFIKEKYKEDGEELMKWEVNFH